MMCLFSGKISEISLMDLIKIMLDVFEYSSMKSLVDKVSHRCMFTVIPCHPSHNFHLIMNL